MTDFLAKLLLLAYELVGLLLAGAAFAAYAVLKWTGVRDGLVLGGRLGFGVPPPQAQHPRIWLHGASLGEVRMILDLAPELQKRGFEVVGTAATASGLEALRRIPELEWCGILPLDSPLPVRTRIRSLNPAAVVLLETEIWPCLMEALWDLGVPIFIVNGRISEKAFRRYLWIWPLMTLLLSRVRLCLARSREDLNRYLALGLPPVLGRVGGDLKAEAHVAEGGSGGWGLLEAIGIEGGPLVVAGSIHPGEGKILGQAYAVLRRNFPNLLLVAVPRHLEKAGTLALEFEKEGLHLAYKSHGRLRARPQVLIWDAYGELGDLYGAADAAVVGGSFIPHGGQNPLEPARLAVPSVFGPHMENFAEASAHLLEQGAAAQAPHPQALAAALSAWLADPALRARASQAARAAASGGGKALTAAAEALAQALHR